MKYSHWIHNSLMFFALVFTPASGNDLSNAFNRASSMFGGWKPSSHDNSDYNRDIREEQSSQNVTKSSHPKPEKPDLDEIERDRLRLKREKEQQRIQENLIIINNKLNLAKENNRKTKPAPSKNQSQINRRHQQLDNILAQNNMLAAQRLATQAKQAAKIDALKIKTAVQNGRKPPFNALWNYYKYNRPIALGLVPKTNRCAIVLSMTLAMEPREGEISLQKLGNKKLVNAIINPIKHMLLHPVKDSGIAKRYYVRAQELANRLKSDWGAPIYLNNKKARKAITGKKGILFIENAYFRRGRYSGDHIDLWNNNQIASSSSTPFEKADKIWFWELK